jgi:hypothetical protein
MYNPELFLDRHVPRTAGVARLHHVARHAGTAADYVVAGNNVVTKTVPLADARVRRAAIR